MESILFILLLTTLYTQILYNASDIIEILRKNTTPVNETLLEKGLENTLEFLKHYIYYNISSDPPQPDFNNSYFPKLDISNLFQNIKTKDTNLFDFKNQFFLAVYELDDLHTLPLINRDKFLDYVYICPLTLISKYDPKTNTTKMYGDFAFEPSNYYFYKNYEQVVKAIQDNLNSPIKYIKGKDPFSFIQDFTGIKLRNEHSTYVFKEALYTKNNFFIPVTLEDLTGFEVEYESGDKFETEYIIQDIKPEKNENNIYFYENKEDNDKFISYLINQNKLNNNDNKGEILNIFHFKKLDDIILEFENLYKPKTNNIFLAPYKSKLKNNAIEWKYTYISKNLNTPVFHCRIDEINKVNVMKIDNFGGVFDSIPSLDYAEKCAYLFDENNYPIIIIFPRNGGGNPIIGYNIIELINPYILTRNIIRIKKDVNMTVFIDEYNENDLFIELNSTNKLKGEYIKDGFIKEKYGNKIEEFSKPFCWKINQKKIEQIKKKLKHKRKPNEIVIFTDGFALSAASIFMKNAYKSGAGIIVGYNGNPNLSDDIFDISQSPTAVGGINFYKNIYPEIYNNFINYPICFLNSISCMATFHEFQESHIPQEYDFQNPDERMKFYNAYDDTYYQEFINEGIKILNKYKENCNPKHEMLVLLSDECKFDGHKHGGYKCGNDYKWNKSHCIPVYCDTGYYYNKISNSCIKYPMDNDKKNDKLMMIIIIVCSAVGFIIICFIVVFIMYKQKVLCFKKEMKKKDTKRSDSKDCEYFLDEDNDE